MKKIFIILTTIATILFFVVACNNEEPFAERTPETERTLSLTASLPNDGPTTRVNLTQDEKNILLTWVVGDTIELVFKQNETVVKQVVLVNSISNEKKRAHFDVDIPQEIVAGSFDLYGVYGGGGLSTSDPTVAILPYPSSSTSLNTLNDINSVESRKDVMLYFAYKNIQTTNPVALVGFKHLGSLFCVILTNTGSTDFTNLAGAALVGVGGSRNWAYNSFFESKTFDLVSETFLDTQNGINYISFKPGRSTIESGSTITFWGWYPPLPNVVWPALKFNIFDSEGDTDISTVNSKPARTEPTMAGKTYYFYAELNDSQLIFTDSNSNTFIDSRDGNVYKFVTIGNQVWMAENLKYLPSVVGPVKTLDSIPDYFVYGYKGTDVAEAKATENYATYGVLYNWQAAMASSTSSSTNPSGIKGVCPTGWHLPSEAEWTQLINYLGGADVAWGKLKEAGTAHWVTPNTGANNESGFTALPSGYRYMNQSRFIGITHSTFWWSTTEGESDKVWCQYISYNNSGNDLTYFSNKEHGYPIRCVKDIVNVGM